MHRRIVTKEGKEEMTEKRLHISKDLSLSTDSATNTEIIVARRRVGKTYTGSVYAEELMEAGLPFCVLDPTGAWWGLASSADGKHEGYPVIIIGGPHGHLPLEAGAGRIIANMIADNPAYYIIDFSRMETEQDVHIFAAAFGRQIMKRQQSKPSALKLILDEADMFVPQKPVNKEHISCFRAYDAIVRRGGINGLGVMLITQRPALINTDVRTQCETLIALTISAPHDQDPVLDWVSRNGTKQQLDQIKSSLASLGRGQAWYFSPNDNIFQLIQIRERRTFNSSATPKPGAKAIEPKVFSKIDLEVLGEEIKNTVERAKLESPEYWRRLAEDLQRRLSAAEIAQARALPAIPAAKPTIKIVEKPILNKTQEKLLRELVAMVKKMMGDISPIEIDRLRARVEHILAIPAELNTSLRFLEDISLRIDQAGKDAENTSATKAPAVVPASIPKIVVTKVPNNTMGWDPASDIKLTTPQQRIIDAIAWMESINLFKPQRSTIAFLARYSLTASSFTNPLGNLRTMGLVTYPDSETVAMTDSGRALANPQETPRNTADLHRVIFERLQGPQKKILKVLIDNYPSAVKREDLAQQAGYSLTASSFTNPLGNLRSFGFIDYPSSSEAIALPILFL
jgi:uncharacterized protein